MVDNIEQTLFYMHNQTSKKVREPLAPGMQRELKITAVRVEEEAVQLWVSVEGHCRPWWPQAEVLASVQGRRR